MKPEGTPKKAAESGLRSVQYVGPSEGRNSDVARACSCSAVMQRGKVYMVPRELAVRLLATRYFEKPTGS